MSKEQSKSNETAASKALPSSSGSAWRKGPLPNDGIPALCIYDTGNDGVVWSGKSANAHCVVAYLPIPQKPELHYEPNVWREPDYGCWIGKYSWQNDQNCYE